MTVADHDLDHGRDYHVIVMISPPTFNDLKEKSTGSDKLRGSDLKKSNALELIMKSYLRFETWPSR